MKAYYERDGITIYHGDCREVLPALGPVDHVITDPPYGVDIYRRMRGNDSEGGNERVCAGGLCLQWHEKNAFYTREANTPRSSPRVRARVRIKGRNPMSRPGIVCAAPNCPNLRPCPLHPARELPRNWRTLRAAVIQRDRGVCQVCGSSVGPMDVDHIKPRREGGSDHPSNLRTVCASYNRGERACR